MGEKEDIKILREQTKIARISLFFSITAILVSVVMSIYFYSREKKDIQQNRNLDQQKVSQEVSKSMLNNLDMLIIELEQNRNRIEDMEKTLDKDIIITRKQSHTDDDVEKLLYLPEFVYERQAYDLMMSSGAMMQLVDKNTLPLLMNIYGNLEIWGRTWTWSANVIKELYVEHTKKPEQDVSALVKDITKMINYGNMAEHFKKLDDSIGSILPKIRSLNNK